MFYVHLKLCRDVLIDPVKRFAYDRFGPDVLHWKHCSTIRDYVMVGVQSTAFYYAGTGAVLAVLGVVGYLQHAPFVSLTVTCPFCRQKLTNLFSGAS